MPLEKGGRADKAGNRYEINWVIYQLLKVIDEKIYSVTLEVLGEDEKATDLLIVSNEGFKEHQQCKARNASKDAWGFSDLKSKNIFINWKTHIVRDSTRKVSLISPLSCQYLVDLNERANNTSGIAEEFYNYQIKNSSEEFNRFYNSYCSEMGLDNTDYNDITKSIDYLKRSFYRQVSEFEMDEWAKQKINQLFATSENVVYNALISLIVSGGILGKEITVTFLNAYFEKEGIAYRSINLESRIYPKISELNAEYDELFFPLQGGYIKRKEAQICLDFIEDERSIILHGKAGYGKSGCTQEIITSCKEKNIPYIAIKLDKHVPIRNCEEWGKSLGLPDSIPHSLNVISKNEKAVIILDQLDSLRWTQSNSSEAISICMELLRQVKYLNYERSKKITVIFVCRTFDLENDNNIESIFKNKESNINVVWERVVVGNFGNEIVQSVVGEKYSDLPQKLKEILRVPSNLYIWQQLEPSEKNDGCGTTSHLIKKWYEQLKRNCRTAGISERAVIETNEKIATTMEKMGRLFVPKSVIGAEETGLDYLKSAGLISIIENKVSYTHQSFLDCFISERMLNQFYEGMEIEDIIGDKSLQSPGRRYQTQMLMQSILEYSSEDFLDFGLRLQESCNVRYYIKYLFYEILAQITDIDDNIKQFIIENHNSEMLLNIVIYGRKQYIKILREEGILDSWYKEAEYKNRVFDLLISIKPNYDIEDILFLSKYAFVSDEDDKVMVNCFSHDINEDMDEMFKLRIKLYQKHPELGAEAYIDLKSMLKKCEMRTIKLISIWVSAKIKNKGQSLYRYEEDLLTSENDIFILHANEVLDELIKYLPEELDVYYSDWSRRFKYTNNLERTVIELIKKANIAIIETNSIQFWNRYDKWMGKGYPVFNEIILHGFTFMPYDFSDAIIGYISEDLDSRIFDLTSGADNKLGLAKKVIERHANTCSNIIVGKLENKIIMYKSPRAVEYYKNRINRNKTKEHKPVYWSFWGDLQYELLQCIPLERLSLRGRELLKILQRKFQNEQTVYQCYNGHGGWVKSPVSGKLIGVNNWEKIIVNKKLEGRARHFGKEVKGGFIESSIEMFAQNFQSVASNEPEIMIELVLKNKIKIQKQFIDALFSGIASSEKINLIDPKLLEKLILELPPDIESWRASYVCTIIEKREDITWSEEIYEIIKMMAEQHINLTLEKPNVTCSDDNEMNTCKMIHSNALNCVRGTAARTIGNILWNNKEKYNFYKSTINSLSIEENLAVKYASLWALWPVYNIDRDWSAEKIINIFEEDIRLTCYHDSKNMFFLLYSKYRDRVINLIKRCYESEEEEVIKIGGYSIIEMYLRHGEFPEIIDNISSMSKLQAESVLQMAVTYLNIDDYNELSKNLIMKFRNEQVDVEQPLSRMFYENLINLERDKDFLIDLMKSELSKRIVHAFTHYLEENALSVVDYSEIILALCEKILSRESNELRQMWGIEDELSKLIIGLYDETVNSNQNRCKVISMKCMDLWDIMFEKQIGSTRKISQQLMDR
jgi:hypothetical protein